MTDISPTAEEDPFHTTEFDHKDLVVPCHSVVSKMEPFKAVVCTADYFRQDEGIILWYTGAIIQEMLASYGNSASECGLTNGEKGIHVWDGAFHWEMDGSGNYTYPDGEWVFHGTCREPTEEEWFCIRQNRNPFEDVCC